jgi:hypothetical protein
MTDDAPDPDILAKLWKHGQTLILNGDEAGTDLGILLVNARDAIRDLLGANARAEHRIGELIADAGEMWRRGYRAGVDGMYHEVIRGWETASMEDIERAAAQLTTEQAGP